MKIFVKDKFFEDADSVRELALSLDYSYSASLMVDPGWRGHRTKMPDSHLKENILRFVSQMFQFDAGNYIITSFFHYTNENTKTLLDDFYTDKYHKDKSEYAGIIYLTPNPIPKSGTSILDGKNNEIVNIENVYNRFVCYPGNYIHAVSNVFGEYKDDARLTLNFFIWHKKNPDYIEGVTDEVYQIPPDFEDIKYDDFIECNS